MLPTKQDALDDSQPRSAMRASDQSAADLRTVRFVRRESAKTRQRASSASDDDDDGDDTIVIEAQPKRVSGSRLRTASARFEPPVVSAIADCRPSISKHRRRNRRVGSLGGERHDRHTAAIGRRRRSSAAEPHVCRRRTRRRSGKRATRRRLESAQSGFALQISLRAKHSAYDCRDYFAAVKSLERHAEVCAI